MKLCIWPWGLANDVSFNNLQPRNEQNSVRGYLSDLYGNDGMFQIQGLSASPTIAGTGLGYTDNSGVHQPVVTIGYDFSGNNADNWLNNGNQPLFVRDISKAVVPSFLLQHVSISQPRAYRPGPTPLQTWEREINGRVKNSMFGFAPLWNNEDDGGGLVWRLQVI